MLNGRSLEQEVEVDAGGRRKEAEGSGGRLEGWRQGKNWGGSLNSWPGRRKGKGNTERGVKED